MKLFTLLLFSFILESTSMAQIKKGQFLAGGNISFESIKSEGINAVNYTNTNFFISPNIGYFILPKFAGGLRLDLRNYKGNPYAYNQTFISLSPFLRYYLLPEKKMFNVLLDLGYLNVNSKNKSQNQPQYVERATGYTVSVGPSIFLNEHVALEFLLGSRHTKVKNIFENKTTTFNTGLGLQIHLGKIKTKLKT